MARTEQHPKPHPVATSIRKRKGPPKFQHLPLASAKKLKQQWVERKKLQSAYFGKKKEGGVSMHGTDAHMEDNEEEHGHSEERKTEATMGLSAESDNEAHTDASAEKTTSASAPGDRTNTSQTRKDAPRSRNQGHSVQGSSSKDIPQSDLKSKSKESREEALARRSLARAAYAPSTLHYHKSDPLHKNSSRTGQNGSSRNSTSKKGNKRGQPDMKLRMNALLEQIKKKVET